MAKIGEKFLLAFFCLLWGTPFLLFGQGSPTKVQATVSERTIYTGQRLRLTITISGDFKKVNRPELPNFSGFTLLNQSPSISQRVSNINGKVTSSYSYSYYLIPKGKGDYHIPAIKVNVDGKSYQTDPISVHVKKRNNASSQKSPSNKNSNSDTSQKIFLRLEISKKHSVIGQQLIANVVLYFKRGVQVGSYLPEPGWKASGFWKESLNNQKSPNVHETVINGVRFRKARLMQFALFPTKSGSLTVSPYHVQVTIQESQRRNDPFNNFFGSFNDNKHTVKLKTNPVKIRVDSLPNADTTRFSGAVGSFTIKRKLSSTKVKVGQTLNVKTTFEGTGNIPLISNPSYKFPSGLEVYQPQEKSNIERNNHNISGSKTFSDVIVVRSPGSFTIPEKRISYYDPDKHKFITETLPAQTVTVTGKANTALADHQSSPLSLKPITGLATWTTPKSKVLYRFWWLWLGILLPVVVLSVAYWQRTYRDKMATDRSFARSKGAVQKARMQLNQALEYADNEQTKQAYNSLQKAIMGFISDRLGMAEAGLSIEEYVEALKAHNVNEDLVKNVRMLLKKCDTINYAPDSSTDLLKSHVGLAKSILKKLKKEV
jgi:hypothetical protein